MGTRILVLVLLYTREVRERQGWMMYGDIFHCLKKPASREEM